MEANVFVVPDKQAQSVNQPPCLFSLEVFAKELRGLDLHDISVAFQMLEFPPVVIHRDPSDSELPCNDLITQYSRGKSCLFESTPRLLAAKLPFTPLSLMLVQTGSDNLSRARLIGFACIDLEQFLPKVF